VGCSGIEYEAKNALLVEGSNPRVTSSVGMGVLVDTGSSALFMSREQNRC